MERNFFLLIFIATFLFGSEQFSFWAKFASKDHILVFDEIYISPLMKVRNSKEKFACVLKDKKKNFENTYEFLLRNKESLFYCFSNANVMLYDDYLQENQNIKISTFVSVLPIRFTVYFKGDLVTIKQLLQ